MKNCNTIFEEVSNLYTQRKLYISIIYIVQSYFLHNDDVLQGIENMN